MNLQGAALRDRLLSMPMVERDQWLYSELQRPEAPPEVALPVGGVPYLPCGVSELLTGLTLANVSAGDRLVDLGAGMGWVTVIAHLLTGASTVGIEIQQPLVTLGRAWVERLGLTQQVELQCADAAAQVPAATVYFMYAPFNGALLEQVLAHLQRQSRTRAFRVITVDLPLSRDWLNCIAESGAVTLYASSQKVQAP